MPFSWIRAAKRSLKRLRLTQMQALIGAILGLPLILLLFWQGVQIQQWGEQEMRAVRRVHRVATFTRLLHQLAYRADFGLEPCPESLHENAEALKTLDNQIHQCLVELEVDNWDREVARKREHPEARLFLTALRMLPTRPADVVPKVWRQQHQQTLDRLVEVIAATAPMDELEYEIDHAGTPVEWYVAHSLPTLVARLGTVMDSGTTSVISSTSDKHRRDLFLNLGRARQAEADATQMLQRLEQANPQYVEQSGSVLAARLQDFSRMLDRIQTRGGTEDPDPIDADAIWRDGIAARQAAEQAAILCTANLEQHHQASATFWQRLSLGVFGTTVLGGALAWAGILWLQTAVQGSLATLHDLSRISPTDETLPAMASFEALDEELDEIARNFLRSVAVIQASNGFAQEAARRATLAELAAKRSEEQFALMSAATSEGLWDWDIRTDQVYHSPQVWKLLGYRPENAPKPSFSGFIDLVHPEDRPMTTEALHAHLERRVPFTCEFRLKNLAGEYRWFYAIGQAKWETNGRPVRMAGSLHDITDQRRLEDERRL
ncbi:MAG: PAS domain-containing protein, partial [Planctomycetaceae bacterium]|nr:PAS domain-containing protein [Planctomycetaceae bacterium]